MEHEKDQIHKIVLVGQEDSKTKFRKKYLEGLVTDEYFVSVGANFARKDLVLDKTRIRLLFWNINQDESYEFMYPKFLHGSRGVFIMIDFLEKNSLKIAENWIKRIKKHVGTIPTFLLGLNTEEKTEQGITIDDIYEFSKTHKIQKFYPINIENGLNIGKLFLSAARLLSMKYAKIPIKNQDENQEIKDEAIFERKDHLTNLRMFTIDTDWEYEYKEEKIYGLDGPEDVSLDEAFSHIDSKSISELMNYDDIGEHFIGFDNEKGNIIYLNRYKQNRWVIDIPIRNPQLKPESFTLKMSHIITAQVKKIVEKFALDPNFISSLPEYRSDFLGIGKRFCHYYKMDSKILETL